MRSSTAASSSSNQALRVAMRIIIKSQSHVARRRAAAHAPQQPRRAVSHKNRQEPEAHHRPYRHVSAQLNSLFAMGDAAYSRHDGCNSMVTRCAGCPSSLIFASKREPIQRPPFFSVKCAVGTGRNGPKPPEAQRNDLQTPSRCYVLSSRSVCAFICMFGAEVNRAACTLL